MPFLDFIDMSFPSVTVLTVDSLAITPLGCYGCSWLETPGFNRLSAQSLLFDRMYVPSTDPEKVLASYLHGVAKLASEQNMPTLFFTDLASAVEIPGARDFDQCTLVDTGFAHLPQRSAYSPLIADDLEGTSLGQLFAAASARRETIGNSPHLMWIHAGSLNHVWDAPLELRESDDLDPDLLQGSDDDEGSELRAAFFATRPPHKQLIETDDPDLKLAWMAAYGAQVSVIDSLLSVLLDIETDSQESVILFASTSGFALGETGWIGGQAGPPRSSRLQVPMMVSIPKIQPLRVGRPLLSSRLAATLGEIVDSTRRPESLHREVEPKRWAGIDQDSDPILSIDDDLAVDSPSKLKISSPWFYANDPSGAEELYLKPDDRHDINNVASLRDDVRDDFNG